MASALQDGSSNLNKQAPITGSQSALSTNKPNIRGKVQLIVDDVAVQKSAKNSPKQPVQPSNIKIDHS